MEIYNNFNLKKKHKGSIILIGNFDGVHSGHRKLFNLANDPKEFYSTEHDDHMMTFDVKLVEKIKKFISKH